MGPPYRVRRGEVRRRAYLHRLRFLRHGRSARRSSRLCAGGGAARYAGAGGVLCRGDGAHPCRQPCGVFAIARKKKRTVREGRAGLHSGEKSAILRKKAGQTLRSAKKERGGRRTGRSTNGSSTTVSATIIPAAGWISVRGSSSPSVSSPHRATASRSL